MCAHHACAHIHLYTGVILAAYIKQILGTGIMGTEMEWGANFKFYTWNVTFYFFLQPTSVTFKIKNPRGI